LKTISIEETRRPFRFAKEVESSNSAGLLSREESVKQTFSDFVKDCRVL